MVDVYLKEVRVPATNLLGQKGQGYWVLQAGIAYGKVGVSSGALGGMQAALELSIKYAKEKQHRDKTISKFQGVQMTIAQNCGKDRSRPLAGLSPWIPGETLTDPRLFAKEAALTKAFVTEAAVDVSRLAIAVHGSYGLMEDYAVSRIYRGYDHWRAGRRGHGSAAGHHRQPTLVLNCSNDQSDACVL